MLETTVNSVQKNIFGGGIKDKIDAYSHDAKDAGVRGMLSTFVPAEVSKVIHDQFFLNDKLSDTAKKTVGDSLYRGMLQRKRKKDLTKYMGFDYRGISQQIIDDEFLNTKRKEHNEQSNKYTIRDEGAF